jgi:methyl-accepting chemotaxis protein
MATEIPLTNAPPPPPAAHHSGPRRLWRSGLFWRMMSGAAIAFLALLVVALLSAGVLSRLVAQSTAMQRTYSGAERVARFANQVHSTYLTLNLLLSPSYEPRFYSILQQDLHSAAVSLRTIAVPEEYRARLNAIQADFQALEPQLNQLNEVARTDPTKALLQWQSTFEKPTRSLRDSSSTLAEDLTASSQNLMAEVVNTQDKAAITILTIGAVGLILGIALTFFVLSRIVRRITGITGDLQRMAEGDLMPPPRLAHIAPNGPAPGADEVSALERAYLQTLERLRTPLQRIQEDAARISASSAEISSAATHQAAGSSQQATAITEVTVTVEELNQTAVQIADAAASVASAAEQALVSASRGQEAVRDSIIGMAMIRSRVNDITARILALSAQSQRISDIIDVIDDMAARTHILALNAAVESAGAGGEVGERFGVVASEVKKLAQRSAGATREVRAVIAQVQAATNAAVMATEDGLKETEKGVQMAHQSGDANEDIIQMVERTAQLANAISLATQQQRTASEQVVGTMREVAQVTRQAAASSEQASRAATDLSDIAQELRTVSAGFRVEHEAEDTPPAGPEPLRATPRLIAGEGAA